MLLNGACETQTHRAALLDAPKICDANDMVIMGSRNSEQVQRRASRYRGPMGCTYLSRNLAVCVVTTCVVAVQRRALNCRRLPRMLRSMLGSLHSST